MIREQWATRSGSRQTPPPNTPRRFTRPLPPGSRNACRTIGDLHSVIRGTGPLVVLLHGFPNTWYAWREVMTEMAQTMTVLALDLRAGLGRIHRVRVPRRLP